MVEVVKHYGCDRIIIDSAADWGMSDSTRRSENSPINAQEWHP